MTAAIPNPPAAGYVRRYVRRDRQHPADHDSAILHADGSWTLAWYIGDRTAAHPAQPLADRYGLSLQWGAGSICPLFAPDGKLRPGWVETPDAKEEQEAAGAEPPKAAETTETKETTETRETTETSEPRTTTETETYSAQALRRDRQPRPSSKTRSREPDYAAAPATQREDAPTVWDLPICCPCRETESPSGSKRFGDRHGLLTAGAMLAVAGIGVAVLFHTGMLLPAVVAGAAVGALVS